MPPLAGFLRATQWARFATPEQMRRVKTEVAEQHCRAMVCRKGEQVDAWIGLLDLARLRGYGA